MRKNKTELEFLFAGDIWPALWGKDCGKPLGKTIVSAVYKSTPFFAVQDFTFLEYRPSRSMIAFNSILKHEKGQNLFYSLFACCEGAKNELVLCNINGCEEDNIEGYVELQKNTAAKMWMYNPYYRKQLDDLLLHINSHNNKLVFCVAGIGWDVIKTPQYSIKFYNGDKEYEAALSEFLLANPDKTEDDFLGEKADASHASALTVTDCEDAYYFSSDIYSIKEFKCDGTKFYCFEIEVLQFSDEQFKDENGMHIKLYVNKQSLGKYKPQVGDNISGVMQLTAYIAEKS